MMNHRSKAFCCYNLWINSPQAGIKQSGIFRGKAFHNRNFSFLINAKKQKKKIALVKPTLSVSAINSCSVKFHKITA